MKPSERLASAYLDAWVNRDTLGHAAVRAVIDATLDETVQTASPGTDDQNRETLATIQVLVILRRQLLTKPPTPPAAQ